VIELFQELGRPAEGNCDMAGRLHHGREHVTDFFVVIQYMDDRLGCFIHPPPLPDVLLV
jgi:hypothetical protein